MEVTRDEMLALAMYETFHLDDRLVPLSREELRSEAWMMGYEFAMRHQHKEDKPGLLDAFNEEYEEFIKARWINSKDQTPEEGEQVIIRIITGNGSNITGKAMFRTGLQTSSPAFYWHGGFYKVGSNVLWRREKKEE